MLLSHPVVLLWNFAEAPKLAPEPGMRTSVLNFSLKIYKNIKIIKKKLKNCINYSVIYQW